MFLIDIESGETSNAGVAQRPLTKGVDFPKALIFLTPRRHGCHW